MQYSIPRNSVIKRGQDGGPGTDDPAISKAEHAMDPGARIASCHAYSQCFLPAWRIPYTGLCYLFIVATWKVKVGYVFVYFFAGRGCMLFTMQSVANYVKFLELHPHVPSYTLMFMLEAMTYKVTRSFYPMSCNCIRNSVGGRRR